MSDIRRVYECGCIPDDEDFCKVGDFLVWAGRDACTALSVDDWLSTEDIARYQKLDGSSSFLMQHHLKEQEGRGKYRDIDFDSPAMQPPDDGYDEDPREVGYPS